MLRWLLVEAGQKAARSDSRAAARLSTVKIPKRTRGGQGGHRAQVGCAVCTGCSRSGADYAWLVRRQGSSGGTLVDASYTAILIGRLAPASDRGV